MPPEAGERSRGPYSSPGKPRSALLPTLLVIYPKGLQDGGY